MQGLLSDELELHIDHEPEPTFWSACDGHAKTAIHADELVRINRRFFEEDIPGIRLPQDIARA